MSSFIVRNLHIGANSEFDFDGKGTDEVEISF